MEDVYRERHGDEPRDEPYAHNEPETPHDSPVVLAHVIAEAIRDIAVPQHEHVWRLRGVYYPPAPRVIHPLVQVQIDTTVVLVRCKVCKVPETIQLTGHWTEDQIRGKAPNA
jgi:hypothetical protein